VEIFLVPWGKVRLACGDALWGKTWEVGRWSPNRGLVGTVRLRRPRRVQWRNRGEYQGEYSCRGLFVPPLLRGGDAASAPSLPNLGVTD
jgi:hypothetical protein